jgi:L-ascorbate metabolism protein UlaG (beta-lactamase superfamily)
VTTDALRLTYVGGPTALLALGGLRLLTDPTFDAAGSEYPTPTYVLRKTRGPALPAESLGSVDAVLLSHDHHADNLDVAGRRVVNGAPVVLTTTEGARRLGGHAIGLAAWETRELPAGGGRRLLVTATPARHGPAGGDRGPVIGFALAFTDRPDHAVYVSGDTVWYEDVAEVGRRFTVDVAVLFTGAARVREVGPATLTLSAAEAVAAARAFSDAIVVPLHFEGWAHYSESGVELERAFAEAGMSDRLRLPVPGAPLALPLG